MKQTVGLVVLSTALVSAGGASAAPVAALHDGERGIGEVICADARRAAEWDVAWTIVFAAAAVGSAGYGWLAPSSWPGADHRETLYVTSAKATIGVVAKLVDPLHVDLADDCDAPLPVSSRRREARLVEAARLERRALVPEVLGGVALNTAGLLYLGYARHLWTSAWVSFGVGTAVGVASTLTAPLQSWLIERLRGATLVPTIAPEGLGLGLASVW